MLRRTHDARPSWAQPVPAIGLDEASDRMLGLVSERPDEDAFLEELLRLVQGVARPAVACSATVSREGRPLTVAMTSSLATFADEVEYGVQDGPCLRCLRTGRPVAVPSMSDEYRWRDFAMRAFAQGVGCSLSLPLVVRTEVAASVNVYAVEPGALMGSEQASLGALVARAGGWLAVLRQQAPDSAQRTAGASA